MACLVGDLTDHQALCASKQAFGTLEGGGLTGPLSITCCLLKLVMHTYTCTLGSLLVIRCILSSFLYVEQTWKFTLTLFFYSYSYFWILWFFLLICIHFFTIWIGSWSKFQRHDTILLPTNIYWLVGTGTSSFSLTHQFPGANLSKTNWDWSRKDGQFLIFQWG